MALAIENPYDKGTPQYKIAAAFIRGKRLTADALRATLGTESMSNRMVGTVLIKLGEQGLTVERAKDPADGMTYTPQLGAPVKASARKAAAMKKAAPAKKATSKKASPVLAKKPVTKTAKGRATKAAAKAPVKAPAKKAAGAPRKAAPAPKAVGVPKKAAKPSQGTTGATRKLLKKKVAAASKAAAATKASPVKKGVKRA